MNHADHVQLLRDGIHAPDGTWADFGSGRGAFTLALAELLGSKGQIYSIDKDAGALSIQRQAFETRFPTHFGTRGITPLEANSLAFLSSTGCNSNASTWPPVFTSKPRPQAKSTPFNAGC